MIIFDVFGKIDKILISKKLQLYIYNLPDDWKGFVKEKIYDELLYREFENSKLKKNGHPEYIIQYDLSFFQRAAANSIPGIDNTNFLSIDSSINLLVDNMICMDLELTSDTDANWAINPFEYRMNEFSHSARLFNLIEFLRRNMYHNPINAIYSNEDSFGRVLNDRILFTLFSKLTNKKVKYPDTDKLITILKKFGKGLDEFIKTDDDYFKLNYILTSLSGDSNYTYFHYVKSFALLEMMLLKRNQKTEEIDEMLVIYLEPTYHDNALEVATTLRQMRNKISHGDSKGYNKKAEFFAQKYMKNYYFDYHELSRGAWILSHTIILLDDLLKEVLSQKMKLIK